MINNDFRLKDKGYSNAPSTREQSRHRWYYYKEGFSEKLVRQGIDLYELNSKSTILDPFNGSGTVTLTASQNLIPSIGFEVNPFTSFVSKSKTLNADPKRLMDQYNKVKESIDRGSKSPLENFSTFTESNKNNSKWLFNKEVLQAYEGGLNIVKNDKSNSSKLLKLALMSSVMDNCNARKDGKCVRYKNDWQEKGYSKETLLTSLDIKVNQIIADLENRIVQRPKIISGDVRKQLGKISEKFDFCITSPPYLNTFDYTDIYRPELFMGKFVKSHEELYRLRLKTLRSHVQARWKHSKKEDFGLLFNKIINDLKRNESQIRHKQIIPMVYAYFDDMEKIFQQLKTKANENAHLWIVVSTSAYANVHIPVDLILADIASNNGWKLREVGVLRDILKRKSKYSPDIDKLRESLIILERK
ncbi:hypothetical protein LX97_00655 [Nonlabens dokdonensis]|uniref:site-specific DNA-methyltransferase (cytosine-N(4)-specific) n=2 Tax=Nonlabens dokdonensis TaxID=328515 RepID=L7W706_NONDD|nr:restriction endonuclease subunit M [Nonlabens dokdonensis]AGC75977.1 putative modification methylase [Nonlabens dokdonensis DSW-6]PZX43654.1 hypothetical protein LX97_00655 [Nonlabens dokdonensis]